MPTLETVVFLTSIADGGFYDMRPPSGETWIVQAVGQETNSYTGFSPFLRSASYERQMASGNEGLGGPYNKLFAAGITNSAWIRMVNSSGAGSLRHRSAFFKVQGELEGIAGVVELATGAHYKLQPPSGEVWLIGPMAGNGITVWTTITDGVNLAYAATALGMGTPGFTNKSNTGQATPIANTLCLNLYNRTGSITWAGWTGVKDESGRTQVGAFVSIAKGGTYDVRPPSGASWGLFALWSPGDAYWMNSTTQEFPTWAGTIGNGGNGGFYVPPFVLDNTYYVRLTNSTGLSQYGGFIAVEL